MEKNVPISKKLWNIVRIGLYMLHKGLSKHKLLSDFNATLKRGKKLMFHNRHRVLATATASSSPPQSRKDYEFSCSDTSNYSFCSNIAAFKRKSHHNSLFACGLAPQTIDDDTSASRAVMELLNGVDDHDHGSSTPALSVEALTALSPCMLGIGRRTSLLRPVRVTDSPFSIQEDGDEANGHVDKAAGEFIKKFYKNLNQQRR